MTEQFFKGDYVRKKNGEPPPVMQVREIRRLADGTVEIYCEWFDNYGSRFIPDSFKPEALERVDPNAIQPS